MNRKFNKFRVNLTGINSIKVYDLLKTINEILGYKNNVKFIKSNNTTSINFPLTTKEAKEDEAISGGSPPSPFQNTKEKISII